MTAPGNGGKTDKYVWTQTLAEVTVHITLPAGVTKKQLEVDIRTTRLKVLTYDVTTYIQYMAA